MATHAQESPMLNPELREYEGMFRAAQRDVHGLVQVCPLGHCSL